MKNGEQQAFLKFDETEKVYVDAAQGCSCFVRVDYFAARDADLESGHTQLTLGEVFKFKPGVVYRISIREMAS